jgi:hypothetical protein
VKTVHIPKRKLIFAALAIVALIGVACVIADVENDPGGGAADAGANAVADAASLNADGQVWPMVEERAYTTQEIEVVEAQVIGEGESPGSVVIEVTLTLTYVQGEGDEPIQEQKTNQVVMVIQNGQWLTDGPPAPSYWSSEK